MTLKVIQTGISMSNESLIEWHQKGAKLGLAFMLICEDLVTPGFYHPEYYTEDQDPEDLIRDYKREQLVRRIAVHGCYSLRKPIEPQLSDGTAWHFAL